MRASARCHAGTASLLRAYVTVRVACVSYLTLSSTSCLIPDYRMGAPGVTTWMPRAMRAGPGHAGVGHVEKRGDDQRIGH